MYTEKRLSFKSFELEIHYQKKEKEKELEFQSSNVYFIQIVDEKNTCTVLNPNS